MEFLPLAEMTVAVQRFVILANHPDVISNEEIGKVIGKGSDPFDLQALSPCSCSSPHSS